MAAKKKAKKKVAKKKVAKKKEFKPSAGTQTKMRRLREELDAIDTLEKQLAKSREKVKDLKSQLQKVMKANGLDTMGTARLSLKLETVDTYAVVDGRWNEAQKYVAKHDAFDLLHRRISATACRERFGTNPPKFLKYKQITKINHHRK